MEMETHKFRGIDEVDELLRLGEVSGPSLAAYIVWIALLFFWGMGGIVIAMHIQGIVTFLGQMSAYFGGSLDTGIVLAITEILVFIFLLMNLAVIVYLKLLEKFARELLMLLYLLYGVLILGSGLFIIASSGQNNAGGIILTLFGAVVLALFFIFRERISLAGRMIEVSAKAINDEKGAIMVVLIKAIVLFWTLISWMITMWYFLYEVPDYMPDSYATVWMASIIILVILGIWSMYFLDMFFNAVVVRLVHDWYRSPEIDVANLSRAFSKVMEVSGVLAKFALVYSILYGLILAARSSGDEGNVAARVLAGILGLAYDIIQYLGFYVVPAIVIRRAGFKDAFRDSVHKLRDLFIETIAGSFGFGIVSGILAAFTGVIFGAIGYLIGAFIFAPLWGLTQIAMVVGIAMGIGAFVVVLIPIGLATSAVSIAWKTILYEYGLDVEFALKGIELPSRLPDDVKVKFREVLINKGLTLPPATPAVA